MATSVRKTFMLPNNMVDWIVNKSERDGMTETMIVVMAIRDFIQKEETTQRISDVRTMLRELDTDKLSALHQDMIREVVRRQNEIEKNTQKRLSNM